MLCFVFSLDELPPPPADNADFLRSSAFSQILCFVFSLDGIPPPPAANAEFQRISRFSVKLHLEVTLIKTSAAACGKRGSPGDYRVFRKIIFGGYLDKIIPRRLRKTRITCGFPRLPKSYVLSSPWMKFRRRRRKTRIPCGLSRFPKSYVLFAPWKKFRRRRRKTRFPLHYMWRLP